MKSKSALLRLPDLKQISWTLLLFFIFLRPFICEQAFMVLGFWYLAGLNLFCLGYLMINRNDYYGIFSSSSLNYFVLLLVASILISLAFSPFSPWSIYEFYLFLPNILLFFIAGRIAKERQDILLKVMLSSALIICLYTIYQYFIGFRHLEGYIEQYRYQLPFEYGHIKAILDRRRIFGSFVSSNVFASYLLMMLFVAGGLFLDSLGKPASAAKRNKIALALGVILFGFLVLVFTKSLAAIFIFFPAMIIFALVSIFCRSHVKALKRLYFVMIAAAFLVLALGCFALIFNLGRLKQLADSGDPNNSFVQRIYYWIASFRMIGDYPLTGIGWRNFGSFYLDYKPFAANISQYAHNLFLQIFAETGIIGLISFLGIVVLFLKRGFSVFAKIQPDYQIKAALFFACLVFLIHNLFDLGFYFGQSALFWWIILGMFTAEPGGCKPSKRA